MGVFRLKDEGDGCIVSGLYNGSDKRKSVWHVLSGQEGTTGL